MSVGVLKTRRRNGTTSNDVRPYETAHRIIACKAAAESIVLLKNEDSVLPVSTETSVALYGGGFLHMIKGGTGSGDVNEREVVSIFEGMRKRGFRIGNEEWINSYDALYDSARKEWIDLILSNPGENGDINYDFYAKHPFAIPVGEKISKKEAEVAFYIVSRVAGEGSDRKEEKGDYYLRDDEEESLKQICSLYDKVVLVLNVPSQIDLSIIDELSQIKSVLLIGQPGMEGGNAVASVIAGDVTPCGKLTDSWAYRYADYPTSATFSDNDGDSFHEVYEEGIYVGYRYFDTFEIPVRYGFGYGLSYTTISVDVKQTVICKNERLINTPTKDNNSTKQSEKYLSDVPKINIVTTTKNQGNILSGKEVIQIYCSCPVDGLEKEYRRLIGFIKTPLINPGQEIESMIDISLYQLASYDENEAAWILDEGNYVIWIGNSLENAKPAFAIKLNQKNILERTANVCRVTEQFEEKKQTKEIKGKHKLELEELIKTLDVIEISAEEIPERSVDYGIEPGVDSVSKEIAEKLTVDQLITIVTGDIAKNHDSAQIGNAGVTVPGSAGETSDCASEYGVGTVVLSDGPAGLRLQQNYEVVNGNVVAKGFTSCIENGLFEKKKENNPNAEIYYQYCTAFPVGSLLAQSWDPMLIEEVGKAAGEEMELFQTGLWLAPGMNIHRDPLCGRNFEYYSEDPLLTGIIASAMTIGVQKNAGCGTTIKHFACNNQENNRNESESVLSERTLREIYLKGFEIAVRSSQPMAIMTSYNLINGYHTANNYDLCTKVARQEWGFAGLIMTDWLTTNSKRCTASGCMRAGNDLVCPGTAIDPKNLREELEAGTITKEQLIHSAAYIIQVVLQSNSYENVNRYQDQFLLPQFMKYQNEINL